MRTFPTAFTYSLTAIQTQTPIKGTKLNHLGRSLIFIKSGGRWQMWTEIETRKQLLSENTWSPFGNDLKCTRTHARTHKPPMCALLGYTWSPNPVGYLIHLVAWFCFKNRCLGPTSRVSDSGWGSVFFQRSQSLYHWRAAEVQLGLLTSWTSVATLWASSQTPWAPVSPSIK